MDVASEEHWDLQFELISKIEQCRRLARQISDPAISQRLFDLAEEYVRQIKMTREE